MSTRARFPLSAKILLWFFANLLLIGLAAYLFLEFEFHLGPESLLGGRAGRRVDALAELVRGEVAAAAQGQWTGVLERAGNLYGLQLLLFTPDGRQLAGPAATLPADVASRLFRPRPPRPPPGMGEPGAPREPGRPGLDDGETDAPPRPEGGPPPFDRGGERPPPPGMDGDGPPGQLARPGDALPETRQREHRVIHSTGRYWLLLPIDAPPEARPIAPMTLVAVSQSIGLGGLLLDVTPWLAAAAGVILFSLLFWLPLVRGITRAIREVTAATAQVAEGRFDVRVREGRGDELGLLARSVNQMTGRLDGFVSGQKRFLGDIAHELCSPLARAEMSMAILEQKLPGESLADLREEVRHMAMLVDELLSFSKASLAAGRVTLKEEPLRPLVARAIEREQSPGVGIDVDVPDDLRVMAEPEMLCRAISNLLRNAIKYAGHAGPIEASAERKGRDIILTIADRGPGVPAEALPKLFDPFYRVDVSRARETGGTGLGLAIVKTCVESCGGRVACRNRDPRGLAVMITLPAA